MTDYRIPIHADPDELERRKKLPQHSVLLRDESDEWQSVSVVAVPAGRRDIWAILRGRYRPMVIRRYAPTVAGLSKVMREVWTSKALGFDEPSPLFTENPDA